MDEDIFDDDGALTAAFLLARGYCCANGCRNCPYLPRHGGMDSRATGRTSMGAGADRFAESILRLSEGASRLGCGRLRHWIQRRRSRQAALARIL